MASEAIIKTFKHDILDATGAPVRSLSVLLSSISQGLGGFAESTINVLSQHTQFQGVDVSLDIDAPLRSEEDFLPRWLRVLTLQVEIGLSASILADSLHVAVESLPEDQRDNKYAQLSDDFSDLFLEAASNLRLGCFFAVPESQDVIRQRFRAALGNLPLPDVAPPQEGSQWPHFGTPQAGQADVASLSPPLLPLISEKVKFAYAMLPFLGRVLALKVFGVLDGSLLRVSRYLRNIHATTQTFDRISPSVNEYFTPPACQDGGESNASRQLRRSMAHASLLTAMLKAMQQLANEFFSANPGIPQPFQPAQYSGGPPEAAIQILTHHMNNFVHVEHSWVFKPVNWVPPPSTPAASGATSAMGMQFLNTQLKDKDSKYRMPAKNASQKQWEDWFERVKSLPDLYAGLSAKLIIPALLGHISVEDGRILGWHEIAKEAQASSSDLSLDQFLSHVRKQVLPAGTARKFAATALQNLSVKPANMADCQALSTKLQQLFRQLYPVTSDESEPITRLNAMRLVHVMLDTLKRTPAHIKSKSARAWKEYTSYNHSEVFAQYLDEHLHTSNQNSVQLCQQYLQVICKHLDAAHAMQIQLAQFTNQERREPQQVSAISTTQHVPEPAGRRSREETRRSVAAAQGDRTRSPGPAARSKSGKGSRKHSSSKPAAARPMASTAAAATPSDSAMKDSDRVQRSLDAAGRAMVKYGQHCAPGRIRHTLDSQLPTLSSSETLGAIEAKNCVLCQQEGHNINKCPLFENAKGKLRDACREYKRAFFDAFYSK
jgi:hypothetical protein